MEAMAAGGDGGLDDVGVGDLFDGELGCIFCAACYFEEAFVAVVRADECWRAQLMIRMKSRSCLGLLGRLGLSARTMLCFGEFDFEGVVLVGLCSGECKVGSFPEGVGCAKRRCRPGIFQLRESAMVCGRHHHRSARPVDLNGVAAYLESGGDGDKRRRRSSDGIADLEVVRVFGELWRRGVRRF